MKKVLTLSKEQSRLLYSLLLVNQVKNRSDNRKRFRFLEVFEDFVFKFEDELLKFADKKSSEVKDELEKLSKETKEFIFKDREIFAYGKDLFEKSFDKGTKVKNPMGKIEESPLVGRNAKIYMELEDVFMDVKESKKD
ncbi:MAG TPA: hypothetical protein ENI23_14555 [bacterium]|nr:hypothetical protein [bacterium]